MAARTGFVQRIRGALFGGGEIAAQPSTPIREASPSQENAAAPLGQNMFTRAYDGFAIGAAWLEQLAANDDSILKREGVQDLRLFDALLDDDVAFTAFQQRQLALLARPWTVEPGNPDDPRSVQAADDLRDMMNQVGWDRVTRRMTFGIWYGYAVAEAIYSVREHNGRQLIWLDDLVVPDRKWFAFTNAGELRMRTPTDQNGLAVPANKFWSFRTGATHDFAHYGTGLAHWCYWPIWFKRNVLQFWALYLEKYGLPTVVVPFVPGSPQSVIDAALAVGKAIGTDSAVAVPANAAKAEGQYDLKPYVVEATRSGGADSYRQFVEERNDAIRGVILGQPGTSTGVSGGLGSDQAGMHKDVRDEVIKADSDEIHESFNRTVATWLTRWNHGPDVAPPVVYRSMDDGEDLNTTAERDAILDELGWKRKDDDFRQVYGDGYEPKPEPTIDPRLGPGGNRLPRAANDDDQPNAAQLRAANFAAGDVAPLYVSRRLINTGPFRKWAAKQGFKNVETDLHVTVVYSRTAVDWFDMSEDYWSDQDGTMTVQGGPRTVEQLGSDGAIVLRFASRYLRYRHRDFIESGASSDYPEYLPHVTITYEGEGVDLAKVEPFIDPLRFGPEIFERLDTDPVGPPLSPAFSADQLDQVDQLTAAMLADADPILRGFAEVLADKVATFEASGPLTEAGLRLALLQALERYPAADMARIMALPLAAEHAGTAAGIEDQVQP